MMQKVVLVILGWYRHYRGLRPDACRFDPTCSAYTVTAVEAHGAIRGLYLGTRRVLRCHPLGGQGYDPVPAARTSTRVTLRKAVSTKNVSRKKCHA